MIELLSNVLFTVVGEIFGALAAIACAICLPVLALME